MVRALGGNDFEVSHVSAAQKKQNGQVAGAVAIDQQAFEAAMEWWCDAGESDGEERLLKTIHQRIQRNNPFLDGRCASNVMSTNSQPLSA